MNKLKRSNGITLIALIVTIIILLILSGVTIGILVNQGIVGNAERAKDVAQIAQDKEIISLSVTAAKLRDENRILILDNLNEELKIHNGEAFEGNNTIIVRFEDRYYEIDAEEQVTEIEVSELNNIVVQCVDSKGTILGEKNYTIFKSEYSIIPPKIEDYECAVDTIEGTIGANKTIKQLYYKIFDDDTELVFTGLNSSGAVTTNESEIVSYMIGNNSDASGNGLLEKTIKGVVKIPETYNGKNVTKIASNAFSSCMNIFKLNIGDNITTILGYAFNAATQLKEITIGKNVSSIEGHAFWNCRGLVTVIVKNKSINPGCFAGAFSWTTIIVDSENTAVKVEDNILYSADGKTLIACPSGRTGFFEIPDTVEKLSWGAFNGSKLEEVLVNDKITAIPSEAFKGNGLLKKITIGKSVTSFGTGAFYNCSSLTTVVLRNSTLNPAQFGSCNKWTQIVIDPENTTVKVENNLLYSANGETLIACPSGIKGELSILNTVKTIGYHAFASSQISSLIIPDSVQTIGSEAFWGASLIREITIGTNVKTISQNAFTTTNITTVTIDSANIASKLNAQGACENLINKATTIYIKDDISTIGSYVTTNFTEAETDKEGYLKYVKQ